MDESESEIYMDVNLIARNILEIESSKLQDKVNQLIDHILKNTIIDDEVLENEVFKTWYKEDLSIWEK
jgi:hypothetical protein